MKKMLVLLVALAMFFNVQSMNKKDNKKKKRVTKSEIVKQHEKLKEQERIEKEAKKQKNLEEVHRRFAKAARLRKLREEEGKSLEDGPDSFIDGIGEIGACIFVRFIEGFIEPDRDEDGPFWHALKKGHHATLRQLIASGEDVNQVNAINESALLRAVACDKLKIAEMLIDNGAKTDVKDNDDNSLLHIYVAGERRDIKRFKWLISKANIKLDDELNSLNKKHETLLCRALKNNNIKIAKELIKKGSRLDIPDDKGNLPIHLVIVSRGRKRLALMEMIIKQGVNIDAQNLDGDTALHCAFEFILNPVFIGMIRKFLSFKPDVNLVNNKMETPLHLAVLAKSFDYVEELIKNGALVNCVDQNGNTPLHKALENKEDFNIEIIKQLLQNGANANTLNKYEQSPLYIIISNSSNKFPNVVDIVKLLIKFNADVKFKYKRDGSGLIIQTFRKLNFQGENDALCLEIFNVLLDAGIDINDQDAEGETAFHSVILSNRLEIAKILIFQGIDVNLGDPLSYAEKFHRIDMIALLKEHGAKKQNFVEDVAHAIFGFFKIN